MKRNVAIQALLCILSVVHTSAHADEWIQGEGDSLVIKPAVVPEKFLNPTTPEYEKMLAEHARGAIADHKGKGYGNTYFENEKNAYPVSMLDFLAGNREKALGMLQAKDSEGYSNWTKGVDFYPCFTLKGQVRKYFWFGPYLDPKYKQTMFEGAKIWTEKDPASNPNPLAPREPGKSPGKDGWMPNATGAAVDTRMTDNLRAMRDVGVYLFAEEVGNEATRQLYKDKIAKFAADTWAVGHGEWDSNNYLYHTFTAYTALYDYAKDDEVRGLAKAVLDYISASAAVKYWRGSFGGPSKRDYGGKGVYGSNSAVGFSYYFADSPVQPRKSDRDDIHVITSAYRPPQAVVALAQKKFDKPVTIYASKPKYQVWQMTPDEGPEQFETTHIAQTYQLGTLTRGSAGDLNGFKLMTFNTTGGVDEMIAIASDKTDSKGISTGSRGGENVAQVGNATVFLAPQGSPILLYLPKTAKIVKEGEWLFIGFEKTWAALHAINLDWNTTPQEAKKDDDAHVLITTGSGNGPCGFAMELGEGVSFDQFRNEVKSKAKASIDGTTVAFSPTDGRKIEVGFAQDPIAGPKLSVDGSAVDFAARFDPWISGENGPITKGWKQPTLTVRAGGKTFVGTLEKQGEKWVYTFENK